MCKAIMPCLEGATCCVRSRFDEVSKGSRRLIYLPKDGASGSKVEKGLGQFGGGP